MSEEAKPDDWLMTHMKQRASGDGYMSAMPHEHLYREAVVRITALRAALDQERAKVRELAESPPLASISLCCGIVRPGYYAPPTMHNGLCRGRHGGELGKTYYLHDVSALLSGRGEGGNDG